MKLIRVCQLIAVVLALLFLSACRDNNGNKDSGSFGIDLDNIFFRSKVDNLVSFTITPDAEVFGATFSGGIARYSHTGDLIEAYPGTEYIFGLNYSHGLIYGYHYINKNILEFNPNNGEIRTIYTNLVFDDVCCLAVIGDYLVMIIIPSFSYLSFDVMEGDFMDFGKQFIAITISSGELTELPGIKHPMCFYKSSTGELYVYARLENQYILFNYDVGGQTATCEAVMDDVGYLYGFAYEHNSFVYYYMGIHAKKMSERMFYSVANIEPFAYGGNYFSYYNGNLVILEQHSELINVPVSNGHECDDSGNLCYHVPDALTSIQTLRIGPEFVIHISIGSGIGQNGGVVVEDRGNIVISAAQWEQFFSIPSIRARTGVTGIYTNQPTSSWDAYTEFLTSIIAGDDSIDIYILTMNESITRALRDQGGYVPLTGSGTIQAYLDSCFDWVREAATTPGGDIWMLPLNYDALMMWYVPEGFERFNISPADVSTFDGYLQVLERLNREKGDFETFSTFLQGVEYYWFTQYEMTYNDYDNGIVDFDTDVFRRYFKNMWAGWDIEGDPNNKSTHHPVMQFDQLEWWNWNPLEHPIQPDYDLERVIFKTEMYSFKLDSGFNLEDWRVLPLPRVSENVQHNYFNFTYALVNPFSNNKELAIEFLEAAARDMLSTITRPAFVLKELSAYEGYFDMSLPVFMDLHSIFNNGAVIENIFPDGYMSIVADYQKGKLSLQESVDEIQRRVMFWASE